MSISGGGIISSIQEGQQGNPPEMQVTDDNDPNFVGYFVGWPSGVDPMNGIFPLRNANVEYTWDENTWNEDPNLPLLDTVTIPEE